MYVYLVQSSELVFENANKLGFCVACFIMHGVSTGITYHWMGCIPK